MDVEPTLASVAFEAAHRPNAIKAAERIRISCSTIDNILYGGFDFGRVSCISGESDDAKSTVSSVARL